MGGDLMIGIGNEPSGSIYNGCSGQESRKVLLTGERGYIVTCLEKWLKKKEGIAEIKKISLRGETWKAMDFSGYDCVVHLAGLAHGRERKEEASFIDINKRLTEELAQKAKREGVKHFVFMSSMAVYGVKDNLSHDLRRGLDRSAGQSLGQLAGIGECTPMAPLTAYGKSKLAAERALVGMADEDFALALIRPPMVYGPGCPGNYQSLRRLVLKAKMFPRYDNARSMIFIDNLCELIQLVIINRSAGVFLPQNREYVKTWQMAKEIAKNNGVNIWCSTLFNPMIKALSSLAGSQPGNIPARISDNLNKVFGSLIYDQNLSSHFDYRYCVCDFQESMERTEGHKAKAIK